MKNSIIQKAKAQAGYRELFAIENGHRRTVYVNGDKCLLFTYSRFIPYQDANGAMYDITQNKWIN